MRKLFSKGTIVCLIILAAIVIDQIIKIEVKSNMCIHESIKITDWFYILFIENNGMAYGMTFINKLVLSIFRIVAVGVLAVYISRLIKKSNVRMGYLACLALVTAGAAGNIFDSMFYLLWDGAMVMPPSSWERWSICSIFRSLKQTCLNGCPYGEVTTSSSSVRFSILPTRASV